MSQTAYNFDPDVAYAGLPVNAELLDVESDVAVEDTSFGVALFRSDNTGKTNSARIARRNQATAVADADIITSNSIAAVVNGVALTATVYATSHLATMTALAAKIDAALLALGITSVSTVGGASNRTITVNAVDGSVLLTGFVVTAGSSQAVFTLSNTSSDSLADFLGIARHSMQPPRRSDGLNGYAAQEAMAVVRKGRIWVPISATVTDGAQAYADFQSGGEGKLTSASTAPNVALTGCRFRGGWPSTGLGLAQLDVNLPQ